MWRLIRNTVSVTCTEAVPVQESMWKFMSTPTPTRGLAMIIIIIMLFLLHLLQLLTPQSTTTMVLNLSFLELLLLCHTISPLFSLINPLSKPLLLNLLLLFLQKKNPPGGCEFLHFFPLEFIYYYYFL